MSTYVPDRWMILELIHNDETIIKIFSGDYGGYLGSDTWKLSSEIEEFIPHADHYEFKNASGSVYKCYYNCYGMSGYMTSIYRGWESKQTDEFKIRIDDAFEPTSEQRTGIDGPL